jgi:OOP family OmpA-OmpF porin
MNVMRTLSIAALGLIPVLAFAQVTNPPAPTYSTLGQGATAADAGAAPQASSDTDAVAQPPDTSADDAADTDSGTAPANADAAAPAAAPESEESTAAAPAATPAEATAPVTAAPVVAAPASTATPAAPLAQPAIPEVMDDRWAIWPMIGGVVSDASDLDRGISGGILATKPLSDHFVFAGGVDYSSLKTSHAGNYNRLTGRLGVELFPGTPYYDSASSTQPFIGLGGHVSSVKFLGTQRGAYGPWASVGIQQRLGDYTSLMLEAQYQIDYVQAKGVLPSDTFYTWQLLAGLRISLGKKPYDRTQDSDGDGVPDSIDRCPNTPHGVQVDQYGCPLDSDGDGVPDYLDKCPNTPKGVQVDQNGCPLDSDGDGVPDYLDKCPNTPKGMQVDQNGCPPQDSDGDGVPDYMDKCPNTPKGVKVDANGCPLDSDGDGVPDYLDECPHTPAGAKVLPNGCALKGDCRTPKPGEAVDANGCAASHNFILKGVKFEFDSARLTPGAKLILDQVAETLKSYPDIDVDVEGHTDYIGSDSYNMGLSERRADSVKDYLANAGVKAKRMTPIGYGKTRPIASNETEEGREQNRRVELHVKD